MACRRARFFLPSILACLPLFGATTEDARGALQSPPANARIMMRWWWFGPAVTKLELESEIRQMKAAGIGGFEVQPVYPLALDDPAKGLRNLRYLSPEFLDAVKFTARKARQYGMRMDITLGSGWPYGGPHISRELAAGQMKIDPQPRIGKTGQMVKRPAVGAEGFVLDHYNREAIEHHLSVVGEKLVEAAGAGGIDSAFCDSLEVYGSNWTGRLPEEFQKRRGYDLLPRLKDLRAGTAEAAAVRHDFGQTLSELYQENFLAPLAKWCHARGLRLRMQNYGTPPATLSSFRLVDLPEGEGWHWWRFTTTRWASSASHLFGRPVTSSETWTWNHSPVFRATPLDLKAEADQHFLCGINQIVGHGWPYSPPQAGEPGWSLYAAAALNAHNPWWPVMPDLARYLQRVSALLRLGEPVIDVGLYLPTHDAWASFDSTNVNLWQKISDRVNDVVPAILEAGFNFDGFDDGAVDEALKRYKVIVLPGVERMPLETLEKLEKFAAAGGKLIAVKRLPDKALPGAHLVRTPDRLREALRAAAKPDLDSRDLDGRLGFVHRRLEDGDLYFIANTANRARRVTLSFRSSHSEAEQWNPLTGEVTALPAAARRTLELAPYSSTIIVLSNRKGTPPAAAPEREERLDWAAGSGPASYRSRFILKEKPGRAVLDFGPSTPLDGGERAGNDATFEARLQAPVPVAAEVWVNERRAGSVWCPPYRLDVAGYLNTGENRVEIRVFPLAVMPKRNYAALEAKYGRRFEMQDLDKARAVPEGLAGPVTLRIGKGKP